MVDEIQNVPRSVNAAREVTYVWYFGQCSYPLRECLAKTKEAIEHYILELNSQQVVV
jgi:hypothetical protein